MKCKSESPKAKVLVVIKRIRESFDDSVKVYTEGSCVRFAMILKEIFPRGEIYYNSHHGIFFKDGYFYDITGEVSGEGYIPLEDYGLLMAHDIMNLKYEGDV